MEGRKMTTNPEFDAKREREIEDAVAKIMRLLVDMTVEDKRRVVVELDRWTSLEESTHAIAAGQQH